MFFAYLKNGGLSRFSVVSSKVSFWPDRRIIMFWVAGGCLLLVLCYLLFLSMGYVAGLADRRMETLDKGPDSLAAESQETAIERLLGIAEIDSRISDPDQGTSPDDRVFGHREVAC
jgi:hypothetical protein